MAYVGHLNQIVLGVSPPNRVESGQLHSNWEEDAMKIQASFVTKLPKGKVVIEQLEV